MVASPPRPPAVLHFANPFPPNPTPFSTNTQPAPSPSAPPPIYPPDSSQASLSEASTSQAVFLDTLEGETALLQALLVHRPFGVDKHWAMIGIQLILAERNHAAWVRIPSDEVWRKLDELYDAHTIEQQVSIS